MPTLLSLTRIGTMAYSSGTHSIAFVTVPTQEVAKTIAHGLITNKLAACVNIIPNVQSVYEWEGKVTEDSELILKIKTRSSYIEKLTDFVKKNHPYSVVEVITVPITNGNPAYLSWLDDTLPDK